MMQPEVSKTRIRKLEDKLTSIGAKDVMLFVDVSEKNSWNIINSRPNGEGSKKIENFKITKRELNEVKDFLSNSGFAVDEKMYAEILLVEFEKK